MPEEEYNLGGQNYETEESGSPPSVLQTFQGVQPLDDCSGLLTPTTSLTAIDTYNVLADSVLFGISLTPVSGTDIFYYIVITPASGSPIFLPKRSNGSTPINLTVPFTWSWPYPIGVPLPRGSTITTFAKSTSGTSTMQVGYNIVNSTGVN